MGRLSSVQTRVTGHHSQCRCRRQASEGYCSVPRAAPPQGTGQCHCLEVNHKMTLKSAYSKLWLQGVWGAPANHGPQKCSLLQESSAPISPPESPCTGQQHRG